MSETRASADEVDGEAAQLPSHDEPRRHGGWLESCGWSTADLGVEPLCLDGGRCG